MEISEVRVKLVGRSSERLRAFCSITLDGDFVIRDLKIIDGLNGAFVAMPSRKLADRCPRCGCKNHLRAKHCNECGARLSETRVPRDEQGRAKLHADVAHPINALCRERIQNAVIEAYQAELEKSKSPDYSPPSFEDLDLDEEEYDRAPPTPAGRRDEPVSEPAADSTEEDEDVQSDGAFSDYDSLISDLKRDAEGRRRDHRERADGARREAAPRRESAPDRGSRERPERSRREHPVDAPAAQIVPSGVSASDAPGSADDEEPEDRPGLRVDAPAQEKSAPEPAREKDPGADEGFGAGLF